MNAASARNTPKTLSFESRLLFVPKICCFIVACLLLICAHSSCQPTRDEELVPQRRIVGIRTPPDGRAGHWRDLAHPAHLCTEMLRLQINCYTVRLEQHLQ